MSLIGAIKKILGNNQDVIDTSLETYADFCVVQLLNNDAPFNNWRPRGVTISSALEDFFKGCVWSYQIYFFYALTAQHYGDEIADKALRIQVDSLRQVSNELGHQHELAVAQIHDNLVNQIKHPYVPMMNGKPTQLPPEYLVALEFLRMGKDAPFQNVKDEDIAKMNDAVWTLTECLAHGRASSEDYFSEVVKKTRIRL